MAIETIGSVSTSNFVQLMNGNVGDGIALGDSKAKVGLYGTVVAQQSAPSTVTNGASGTLLATAINALITILKNLGAAV